MKHSSVSIRGLVLACLALIGLSSIRLAEAGPLDLVCSGNSYARNVPFPTPVTYTLRLGGTKSVLIGVSNEQQPVKAPVISNNDIQLKFKTAAYIGEYFHLTGDLFLIHPDGRLTRLTCRPP
ncbi:MAG TPA: hypothetical protein VFG05_00705 [Methylocella sp.]|nr:hypothetical protein [Methylocella sp.]